MNLFILLPVLVMVCLTFSVAIVMYRRRIAFMKKHRIHPQKVNDRKNGAELLSDSRASDNYMNLFELPVLFYLAAVIILITQSQTTLMLVLAWGYVLLRIAHSVIHCSYNKVMHRFITFIASTFVLLGLWVLVIIAVLEQIFNAA